MLYNTSPENKMAAFIPVLMLTLIREGQPPMLVMVLILITKRQPTVLHVAIMLVLRTKAVHANPTVPSTESTG